MKSILAMMAGLALAASAPAAAAVTYDFVSGPTAFTLMQDGFVTADEAVDRSGLASASPGVVSVFFCPDPIACGFGFGEADAIQVTNDTGGQAVFYFADGAFAADGTYSERTLFGGTLTVAGAPAAVPEPVAWLSMLSGLACLGSILRRWRRTVPARA